MHRQIMQPDTNMDRHTQTSAPTCPSAVQPVLMFSTLFGIQVISVPGRQVTKQLAWDLNHISCHLSLKKATVTYYFRYFILSLCNTQGCTCTVPTINTEYLFNICTHKNIQNRSCYYDVFFVVKHQKQTKTCTIQEVGRRRMAVVQTMTTSYPFLFDITPISTSSKIKKNRPVHRRTDYAM